MRPKALLAALCCLISAECFATGLGELNLRIRSETEDYRILFCARTSPDVGGLPGHAFVSFTKKENDSQLYLLSIGHSPNSASLQAALGIEVGGMLVEENYSAISQECFTVLVNVEQFEKGLSRTKSVLTRLGLQQANKQPIVFMAWQLAVKDCVTFVQSVAKSIGLKTPPRSGLDNFPIRYIRKLAEKNQI